MLLRAQPWQTLCARRGLGPIGGPAPSLHLELLYVKKGLATVQPLHQAPLVPGRAS